MLPGIVDDLYGNPLFVPRVTKRDHAYYYQVQLQMKLCQTEYCDFIVWRPHDMVVLRIVLDEHFIDSAIAKAMLFFKAEVFPELVGKWYTKTPLFSSQLPLLLIRQLHVPLMIH